MVPGLARASARHAERGHLQAERDAPNAVTVWSVFPPAPRYFRPSRAQFMINLGVDDVSEALCQVELAGGTIVGKPKGHPFGRFGWSSIPMAPRSSCGSRRRTTRDGIARDLAGSRGGAQRANAVDASFRGWAWCVPWKETVVQALQVSLALAILAGALSVVYALRSKPVTTCGIHLASGAPSSCRRWATSASGRRLASEPRTSSCASDLEADARLEEEQRA